MPPLIGFLPGDIYMFKLVNENKASIIMLHEIYGINDFMEDICLEYHTNGFDIYCPDMIFGNHFSYNETEQAYHLFRNKVGFNYYLHIEELLKGLRPRYDTIFIMGFSIGATIGWRCCRNAHCDGIICCYGSRIRDFIDLNPACPALLIFAEEDSFDVDSTVEALREKPKVEIHRLSAHHGFIDPYSPHYNRQEMQISKRHINRFLKMQI